jgi:CRP-like cAMP-binding protein
MKEPPTNLITLLVETNYLFREFDETWLESYLTPDLLKGEKLFSNRPVYTAFLPDDSLEVLYVILDEGLVIARSTPLDRIIAISYPGGCFGMRSLPFSYGLASRAFPMLVEAYKTTHVLKIPLGTIKQMYDESEIFRDHYRRLFELREKFIYHLLNCSTYPPQAVAALLRALIYQERELGNQPKEKGVYVFDLPNDVIARACQLNQRTVEQVLKGMQQVGLIAPAKAKDLSGDTLRVIDPEGLKEVYSATRDKVSWWPLK